MRHVALIAAFVASAVIVAAPATTQDFYKGVRAYQRGDYAAALREWLPLAEQGHTGAQYNVAGMYKFGEGVPHDAAEAAKWFRRAAERGSMPSGAILIREAPEQVRRAAEQGHAGAQNELGLMYQNGHGVAQDYGEAAKWFRRAAEQGYAEAQKNLGIIYAKGQGVPQDHAAAVRWYEKAAEQGHAVAQFGLGEMYRHGDGVPQDYIRAHMWLNLAAAFMPPGKRDVPARLRDFVAKKMTPEQIGEAQRLAREKYKSVRENIQIGEVQPAPREWCETHPSAC